MSDKSNDKNRAVQPLLVLMLGFQQVIDGLHRIECRDRDLNEKGVPARHRTVPQSGQLQCLERSTLLRLRGDEACLGIGILQQVELFAFVVFRGADQIHRVEVRTGRHDLLFVGGDLRRLGDLQRFAAVRIDGPHRTSTGLSFVLYHAADPDRTVEQIDQQGSLFLSRQSRVGVWQLFVQFVVDERLDLG